MWPKIFKTFVLVGALGLLLLPMMTQAATFRGEQNLVVNEETVDLYAAGSTVDVLKPVTGDLTVAGGTVIVSPEAVISGNMNAAGGQLQLDGHVAAAARVGGGTINIGGEVGRDLLVAGGTVLVTGTVKGDVYVTGGTVSLGGIVEGNVIANGGNIILTNGANIKGNLEYSSENTATIAAGAMVGGGTTFHQITRQQNQWQQNGVGSFVGLAGLMGVAAPLIFVFCVVAIFLLTLLVTFAAPLKTQDTARHFVKHPWKSLGFGLVYLIATPIVGFILLIIPFTFMIGAIILLGYLLSLFLLPAVLAFFIGSSLFRLLHKQADFTRRGHLVWMALIGAVIYSLIMFIPLVGGLLIGLGILFSAGALVMVLRPLAFKKREWNNVAPTPPNA